MIGSVEKVGSASSVCTNDYFALLPSRYKQWATNTEGLRAFWKNYRWHYPTVRTPEMGGAIGYLPYSSPSLQELDLGASIKPPKKQDSVTGLKSLRSRKINWIPRREGQQPGERSP